MLPEQNKDIDNHISSILVNRYAFQSRRSFMYRLSRAAFGVLGITLVKRASLFLIPEAKAQSQPNYAQKWYWCHMDGMECGIGNCSGTTTNPAAYSWVGCCPNTDPDGCNLYHCLTYTDVCQASFFNAFDPANNCQGHGSGDTQQWCSGGWSINGNTPYYVCTKVDIGSTGYQGPSTCANNCQPTTPTPPPVDGHLGPGKYACP